MTTENLTQPLKEKIKELEQENKQLKIRKKYGLVWEEKTEKFEEKSKNAFPILITKSDKKYPDLSVSQSVDDSSVKNQKPHILIEGDNYHSLSILSYTHKNKIDVIYIDPPYNTGNKDFKYRDKFIDKEDSFRHSKWLSFMAKRLRLAKYLLKDDGVIFISIDDNEQAQLKLLCDEIFGENNFVANLVWTKKNKTSGVPPVNLSLPNKEYILVYAKKSFKFKGVIGSKNSYKKDRNGKYFRLMPIQATGKQNSWFNITNPKNGNKHYGNWAFSESKIKEKISNNEIYFPNDSKQKPNQIVYFNDNKKVPIFHYLGLFDSEVATKSFKNIGVVFDFPKPIELILFVLNQSSRKNATILDFFAGSGTTGHAVLELNKEDGGNRQFILCTNNENNICEEVTYERIKRVMQGYTTPKGKNIDGLGGELKYLKTDFIKKQINNAITDEDKINLTYKAGYTIALKENTFKEVKKTNSYQVFDSETKITAIYFSENKQELSELVQYLSNQDKTCKLYIFSWIKGEYKDSFKDYENIITEDIPEPILEIYKNIGVI